MLPLDLEAVLARGKFREKAAGRAHLLELATDPAELLALVRISAELGDALAASADPDAALRHLSRFVHARGSREQLYHVFSDDPVAMDRLIRVLATQAVNLWGTEQVLTWKDAYKHADAFAVAENIRGKVAHWSEDPTVTTVSIGIASMTPISGFDWSHLVEAADKALYAAKANGRNQSVVATIPQLSLVA